MSNKSHFYISIIVILIYPLVPLIAEGIGRNDLLDTTLLITAMVYCITVLTSSNNPVSFFLSLLVGFLLLMLYNKSLKTEVIENSLGALSVYEHDKCLLESLKTVQIVHHNTAYIILAIGAILTVAIVHGLERHKRHWMLGEEFVLLKKKNKENAP